MGVLPSDIIQNKAPSLSFCTAADEWFAGGFARPEAATPSPRPLAPWHIAQLAWYSFPPAAVAVASPLSGLTLASAEAGAVKTDGEGLMYLNDIVVASAAKSVIAILKFFDIVFILFILRQRSLDFRRLSLTPVSELCDFYQMGGSEIASWV
jgi:hypothetical protein